MGTQAEAQGPGADQPLGYIPAGRKLTLRCPDKDCWIGDIQITSNGGMPQQSPGCPNCRGRLQPETTL